MGETEIVAALKQIVDEAKKGNARLGSLETRVEQTNQHLDHTNRRLDETVDRLDQTVERLDQTVDRLDQTIARVDETNGRLDLSIARADDTNERLDRFESRVSRGFDEMSASLSEHFELLIRRQTDSELRLATDVLSLSDVTRQVRDLLAQKLDDHHMVRDHEDRIRSLENRIADRSSD